jgi:hypothetical protein
MILQWRHAKRPAIVRIPIQIFSGHAVLRLSLPVIVALALGTQLFAAGYEPDEDYVQSGRDRVTGIVTTMAKTQAACHAQSDVDRLIQFAEVKDGHGISAFLSQRMAANECVILMLGETVTIDASADLANRVCVLPTGQRTCFWTLSSGVNLRP